MTWNRVRQILISGTIALVPLLPCAAQTVPDTLRSQPVPIVLSGDTLFSLSSSLGPFTPRQRAEAIVQKLTEFVSRKLDPRIIHVQESPGLVNIVGGDLALMAVTSDDAAPLKKSAASLGLEYADRIRESVKKNEQTSGLRAYLVNIGFALLALVIALLLLFLMRWLFPKIYSRLERWEGTIFRPVKIRGHEFISSGAQSAFFIVAFKGLRLVATLVVLYGFILYVLQQFPGTAHWNARPVLIGIFLAILSTTAALVLLRGINSFFRMVMRRVEEWRGSLIKPITLKTLEVLSEERIVGMIAGVVNVLRLFSFVALVYVYITFLFSFFEFTQTWAGTLIRYIVDPLWDVLVGFVRYLPSLFFILVIAFVTRFVIKFIKLIFDEVGRGTITLPGFFSDWAEPTYKIVRFLVLAFAAIVIFPYLPGSSSPVFQGISVFLGILFSLGSTGAVANMVAGVVLTYMRPFKLGDRVKIADTVGDIIEKTLLVTRVRTIKNVDITIPNSMVLGSHIVNFSSSALERGLILHTTVTIGYDAEWRKVHELLIAAAAATEDILPDPKPFILQTALGDFNVSYELNAYTDKPNKMAVIYSDLNQHIQDKFNEAGVEIMSPHFAAVRDGNTSTIPDAYLPKPYTAPSFRIMPTNKPEKPA